MNNTTRINNSPSRQPKPRLKRRRNAVIRSDRILPRTRRRSSKNLFDGFRRKLLFISIEITALFIAAACATIVLLGHAANRFSGAGFFANMLPFTAGILILILITSIFLIGWWKLRQWLRLHSEYWILALSVALALQTMWFVTHDQFTMAYGHFRTLVGGKEEAGRVTIAHQVYAAYRRQDSAQLQKMLDRSRDYREAIEDASRIFRIDVHLLHGLAATESSFIPRTSSDGGRGLFQITRVPEAAINQARRYLGVEKIALDNHKHNAFVAAATFKHYLAEMNDDLFLGLLAYNIGPANGGLRFIMQQYGATDFTTIQPYLQTLPRDYPIRVLSYSLAFRLWHQEGKLLAYEEGSNAIRIQRIGIPGLHGGL